MTPELQHALDELKLIELLGVRIPVKSREAILTAIMNGCYDVTIDGIRLGIGDMVPAASIVEEQEENLKPAFGL